MKRDKKCIKKNYIYNLAYQAILLVTPLLTAPYLSRVLGPDGIGSVSFAESIVSYFVLFATLGITTYGQREISYLQDSRSGRTQVFWEAKALGMITGLIALTFYIPFSLMQENSTMYFVLAFRLAAVMADVVWLFQGMEEFGRIVFRNIFLRIISIAYIFIAVKTENHLNRYVFGVAFFAFLGNASLWFCIPKYVGLPSWGDVRPMRNLRVVVSLFIPTVAIQIYTVLDKTMIGIMTRSALENGYYEQAIQISKMLLVVVTSLGTVMIPRIGYHYSRGETEVVNAFLYRGYRFVWFLGLPLCLGIMGVAPNFIPWFFGDGYEKVVPLLGILSLLILAIGINNVTGSQYLIPTGRQHLFTMSAMIGAGVNFTLNLFLIRFFQSIGAAIASVTAETVIALVELYLVRGELSVREIFASCLNYLLAGGIMLALLKMLGCVVSPSIFYTAIMVACGGVVYLLALLLMKDEFLIENLKNLKNILKKD